MATPLSPERDGALRLHLAALTPRQRELAVAAAGGVARVAGASAARLAAAVGDDAASRLAAVTTAAVEVELDTAARRDMRITFRDDARWPPLLREAPDAPWALWVRGELPDPARVVVVVVGARRPTPYGLAVTRELTLAAARRGVVVVSGGAAGIDGCAHGAALEAGVPTVAVLGCGSDVPYPSRHRELFERIAAAGAVVSEHPCGTQPRPHHFPVRNRILAAWAPAVLVTEATERSGSLITARLALEAGRDVLAVPGPITSALSGGTNRLIADGARLVSGAGDVLDELGLAPEPDACDDEADDDDPLLGALPRGESVPLDTLAAATSIPAGDLLARLIQLEAQGRVQALPGGSWMRRARA